MKWRNSKERELLSVGVSRDVTLPSKDNPYPDLSNSHELREETIHGQFTDLVENTEDERESLNLFRSFNTNNANISAGQVIQVNDQSFLSDSTSNEEFEQKTI